jgi:hypothetical protein
VVNGGIANRAVLAQKLAKAGRPGITLKSPLLVQFRLDAAGTTHF